MTRGPATSTSPSRGQANLPALAVALLLVTTATGLGLAMADGAFASADRDPRERHVAVSLSERLVAADGPLTTRGNTLNRSRVANLTADRLADWYPVADGSDVRLRLDGETVVERGDPTGGTTIRRVVLLERRSATTLSDVPGDSVTLPRRTPRVTLVVDPPAATTVTTVRANDRVVLHDPSGLDGTYEVSLSRFETTTLAYEHTGPLPRGSVEVTYYPARTTKAELVVTVDG
ncbi:hypothetical protein ACFPYI_06235 [Halomarina salina]|uniref:Uncharacterized protein n=1 Tax=Halomarina salina TaxID=1872699 RepID=A0ABD5RK05_9EURY|nr:hypothetical protein [Halomarina salina]